MSTIEIRLAADADYDAVWTIIREVLSTGDTYTFAPDSPRDKMLGFWFSPGKHTYVALRENRIVGTFFLKENQPDLGSHVANAGYMVASDAKGHGVGRAMAEFSFDEARRLGFTAMQFNFVVKSNENAVALWQKLGFKIIGEIPDAFAHPQNGFTNALIMFRRL